MGVGVRVRVRAWVHPRLWSLLLHVETALSLFLSFILFFQWLQLDEIAAGFMSFVGQAKTFGKNVWQSAEDTFRAFDVRSKFASAFKRSFMCQQPSTRQMAQVHTSCT